MNIRTAIVEAVLAARVGWNRVYVMATSPKWSVL